MLHLCHMATIVEEHHFRIGEVSGGTCSSARIDQHIILAIDREDRLADPACEPPWPIGTAIGEGQQQAAQGGEEGIGCVGKPIALGRLRDEGRAKCRRDTTGIGHAGIQRRLDALLDRHARVAAHE